MAQNPFAHLLVAVVNQREREATRVSRLLHDEVSQLLSAVGLKLDLARGDIAEQAPEVAHQIQECQGHLEEAMGQLRSLSYELHPNVVERAGLQTALNGLVGRYRAQTASVRLLFDSSVRLPLEASEAFYKIAENALLNAATHAEAGLIELFVKPVRGGVALEIRDDGQGFDLDSTQPGLGLLLMRHHAAQNSLDFVIQTNAGQGTIVKAVCPLS